MFYQIIRIIFVMGNQKPVLNKRTMVIEDFHFLVDDDPAVVVINRCHPQNKNNSTPMVPFIMMVLQWEVNEEV